MRWRPWSGVTLALTARPAPANTAGSKGPVGGVTTLEPVPESTGRNVANRAVER